MAVFKKKKKKKKKAKKLNENVSQFIVVTYKRVMKPLV